MYSRKEIEKIKQENEELKQKLSKNHEALDEDHILLEKIWDVTMDGMVLSDKNAKVIKVNDRYCEIYDYAKEELVGKNFSIIFPPEFREMANTSYQEVFRNEIISPAYEAEIQRKDGSNRIVSSRVEFINDKQGEKLMLSVVTDITAEKKVKEKLIQNEHFWRKVSEISPFALYVIDIDKGDIEYCNKRFEKLTGYDFVRIQQLGPDFLEQVYHPDEISIVQKKNKKLFHDKYGKIHEGEFRIIDSQNQLKWIFTNEVVLSRDNKNKPIKILGAGMDITNLKNTQQELIIEKEKFKGLFDNINAGAAIYEPVSNGEDFIFADINEAGLKYSKLKKQNVLGKSIDKVFPVVKKVNLYQKLREVYTHGSPVEVPVVQYEDNKIVEWLDSFIYKLPSGLIVAIYHDITEQKQAEEALKESKERLSIATSSAGIGIWELDLITGELIWDVNMHDLYETSPKDFEGTISAWENSSHPQDYEKLRGEYLNTIYRDTPFITEFRIITPTKKTKYIKGFAHVTKNSDTGKPEKMIGANYDVTHLKETLLALKENEEKYRYLHLSAGVGIGYYKPNGEVISFNQLAAKHMGGHPDNYKGKHLKELFPEKEAMEYIERINKTLSSATPLEFEDEIKLPTGNRWFSSTYAKILDDNNKVLGVQIVSADITEKKKIIKDLKIAKEQAEKSDKLKTTFLANMSHEIRTPMNGIIGFSEMYMKPWITEEKRKYYAKIVIDSSQKLLSVVSDILDISRIETDNIELVCQNVVVNDIIRELYAFHKPIVNDKDLTFTTHKDRKDEQSIVLTDKTRLTQVLSNLLSNAIKYTREGHIRFGYNTKKDHLEFFVEDTGKGIKTGELDLIFQHFRQGESDFKDQQGGTGLGLCIAKSLVELMGGKIWVNSLPGKGSTFYFSLPHQNERIHQEFETHDFEKLYPGNDSFKFTILIAEDEETNYLFMEELISEMNINLLHARDGIEACELFEQHPEVNLVFMDIKMPNMDGYEATENIKALRPEVPVIMQTAYTLDVNRQKALKAKCDEFVSKPLTSRKVKLLLNKYLVEG